MAEWLKGKDPASKAAISRAVPNRAWRASSLSISCSLAFFGSVYGGPELAYRVIAIGIELDVEVLESQAPALLRVAITGNDRRLRTRLQQDVRVSLRSQGERQTMVEIVGQFTLEGLLASLSRNLIAAQVTQIVDDFAGALRAAILQRQAAADRGSAPAKSESAS